MRSSESLEWGTPQTTTFPRALSFADVRECLGHLVEAVGAVDVDRHLTAHAQVGKRGEG